MSEFEYFVENTRTKSVVDFCADMEEAFVSARFFNEQYQTNEYRVFERKVQHD